jgi:hypothetical protein
MSFLNFLCFNVHGLQVDVLDILKKHLNEEEYDFIIVQETWFLNEEDDYVAYHSPLASDQTGNLKKGGVAILRHPRNKALFSLLYSSTNVLLFSFNKYTILTPYLPPSWPIEQVQDHLQNVPSHYIDFIIGDLNFRFSLNNDTTPTNYYRKCFIDAYCQTAECYWIKPTYDSGQLSSRNDHCYAHSSLQPLVKMIERTKLNIQSDHDALSVSVFREKSADIQFKDMDQSTFRIYIRKLQQEQNRIKLRKLYESYSWLFQIDEHLVTLTNDIEERNLSKEELSARLDYISLLLSECMWTSSKHSIGMYEVSSAKEAKRKNLTESDPNSIAEARLIFKRSQRSTRSTINSLNQDGNALDDAYEKFNQLFNVDNQFTYNFDGDLVLFDHTLDIDSLRKVIQKYPNDKSCGADGLHTIIFKSLLNSSLVRHLWLLYRICLRTGLTPLHWNSLNMVLIPKKKENVTVEETRPISLTIMQRRFFEMVLMRRLKGSDSNLLKTHGSQCSAKPGYSCLSHALVGDDILKLGKKYSVMIDFRKAFDTVDWFQLKKCLDQKNVGQQVSTLIESLFMHDPKIKVVVNGLRSQEISMKRGILQGSVLSPALFNLYIDSLLEQLNDIGDSTATGIPTALGYADDIRIFAESKELMQILLDVVQDWSIEKKLEVNLNKTFLLTNDPGDATGLSLFNATVNGRKQDLYLGIETTATGSNWYQFLKTRIDKTKKMLWFLKKVGQHWSPAWKVSMFKIMVRPILEYCAPATSIWLEQTTFKSKEIKDDLAALDNEILKFVFGHNTNRKVIMQWMSFIEPSINRFQNLRIMSFRHFGKLNNENPAKKVLEKVKFKNTSTLYKLTLKTKEWTQWITTTGPNVPCSKFLMGLWKSSLSSKKSKLMSYIFDSARSNALGVDGWMNATDFKTLSFCFGWRAGLLWAKRTCTGCNESFKRKCLNECGLAAKIRDEFYDLDQDYATWLTEAMNIDGHYTLLDSLLNHFCMDKTKKVFIFINSTLVPLATS